MYRVDDKDTRTQTYLMIKICWVLLAICFGIKILGFELFEILIENQRFIDFCDFVDKYWVVQILIYFPMFALSSGLTILAMLSKTWFSNKELKIVIITLIIAYILKCIPEYGSYVCTFLIAICCPIILDNTKIKSVAVGNVLIIVFQLISTFIKSESLSTILAEKQALFLFIYMIDVYIMLFLYYFYRRIKE